MAACLLFTRMHAHTHTHTDRNTHMFAAHSRDTHTQGTAHTHTGVLQKRGSSGHGYV